MPERVIQFGEGNFLRAFGDWMINRLNSAGLFNGHVVVVQPIKLGIAHLLNEQDGCYTLLLRGLQDGQVQDNREVITAVSRGLDPYQQWHSVLECARNPEMRFMLSNTTEAGIVYQEEPQPADVCPNSFPAKVTAFLYERFNAFSGAADKGMVIIPCELIDRNGDKLRQAILKHAADWKLEKDFTLWLKLHCHFLNTLVDRIVPGYPRENAEALEKELGYEDKLLDTGELFHLWVIEGPQKLSEELPFHKLGLNVVWTDDMTPYRTRKVSVLNGAHTSSVLAAYLSGLDTVGEMMDDEVFAAFLNQAVLEEILPVLPGDPESNRQFAQQVMDRFRNPYIKHPLLSISLNSVSKWKVRVMPSLLKFQARNGSLPDALTFSLAALISFYNGVGCAEPELRGTRNGQPYSIKDDVDVLSFFEKRWYAFRRNHDLRVLVGTILSQESLWEQDLTLIPGLIDQVTAQLQNILVNGTKAAAQALSGN
jgi:tagaturonate reductase